MNMLKELKKVSLKKVLPMILICFVVGLVLLGIGAPSAITVLSGGTDINRVPVNELEGKYVSAEIPLSWIHTLIRKEEAAVKVK